MDIKELRKSVAYRQLRDYVRECVEPGRQPYQLGQLAKRFMARYNEQHVDIDRPFIGDIDEAFIWQDTAEGHHYWCSINDCEPVDDLNPCPINGVAKAKVAKIAPKKRVGWWTA